MPKQFAVLDDFFFEETLNGKLGPTATYWAMYIHMVNRIHGAYIQVLPEVLNVFFALNRLNHAQWGVLLLTQLQTADDNCLKVLRNGAFSIRRTSENYSRSAINLTSEEPSLLAAIYFIL